MNFMNKIDKDCYEFLNGKVYDNFKIQICNLSDFKN